MPGSPEIRTSWGWPLRAWSRRSSSHSSSTCRLTNGRVPVASCRTTATPTCLRRDAKAKAFQTISPFECSWPSGHGPGGPGARDVPIGERQKPKTDVAAVHLLDSRLLRTIAPRGTAPPPSAAERPQKFTGERAKVAKAVDTWLNADTLQRHVSAIEDGDQLRGTIKLALERAPAPLESYAGRVDDVEIVDDEKATVTLSILLDATPVVDHRKGRAVRIKGEWKVARKTVCDLLALGGARCPPHRGV